MAPSNLGGRPRIPWTTSRRRKLVRLYLMTDFTISDIKDILAADGFAPGTRNIQTQLSQLLQDNDKAWRLYRPSGIIHGKTRLTQLKRCRKSRVDRKFRRKAASDPSTESLNDGATHYQPRETSPFYDPTRHYEGCTPSGLPSHCSLQLLSKRRSYQHLDQGQSQIPPQITKPTNNQKKTLSETRSSSTASISASSQGEKPTMAELEMINTSKFLVSDDQIALLGSQGVKGSYSKITSVAMDIRRNLSWRGPSRIPTTSWSYVNSVLSLSISWRSNLASKMSSLSRRTSSMNASSWMYQFIDKSKVTSPHTPRSGPGSLHHRPCCSFFEGQSLTPENKTCHECGYSQAHHLARFSLSDDLDLIDTRLQDAFGNTPLHHAAAAGNTLRVIQLMSMAGRILTPGLHHRNADGQTYLHVLRIENPQDFPDLMTILQHAKEQGVRLSERDHSGSTVKMKLQQLVLDCNFDRSQQLEIKKFFEQSPKAEENLMSSSLLGSVTVSWALPSINEELEVDEAKGIYLGTVEMSSPTSSASKLQPSVTTASETNIRTSTFSKPTKPVQTAKLSILERDSNGDTLLLSVLKKWPFGAPTTMYLKQLITHSDVQVRDCHEYTALAIAARRGLRDAVVLLLERGANPNTKSLYKTSVLEHVFGYLWRAEKEENDVLYAKILSCMVLLIDHGAETKGVDVVDQLPWP